MIVYLDTSAALKLIVREAESEALTEYLNAAAADGGTIAASMLLFTELHCAAERRGWDDPALVNGVLDRVSLIDLERADFVRAATSRWGLRSADALHLACAVRIEADTLVTYDAEFAAAAVRASVTVERPT